MSTHTLLLWDIDGTLVLSGGAGMRALMVTLDTVFGIRGSLSDIDFAGRTDKWITKRIFEKFGIEPSQDNFDRFLGAYVKALPSELSKSTAEILPGVRPIIEAASRRNGLTQGLLTGNLRKGAEAKLRLHSLWEYFPFGAFADDSEFRNELGPFALARAQSHAGVTFERARVWVIGDTPHDVACGKAIGASTLAVATGGHHDVEALVASKPTAVLRDLSDADAFWAIIDGA